ncbi:unnamed protein product [Moneuplotes crassus]|uniref:Uncharacterized protein n=1 Tax=Euplotes crassus TaxID=5936 RepID=A0AAD1U693_EUPCR|nr:unnamed protein product [Moneuplotes crassus]
MDPLKNKVKIFQKKELFNFTLETQTNYEYLASNLVAEAFEDNRVPIAIRCTWKRVKGKRVYKMNDITGNTYPLSADDVGCIIRVEATAMEDHYEGTVYAEFGPVTVEPATKKSLEYILASGSSQFPVSVYYHGDRNKLPEEREGDEGKLIVYVDKVELYIKKKKTTIVSPKVEVSQVDSQMLHLCYFDKDEMFLGEKEFSNSLDIRALTRKSRDLIVLSIRCFSALNQYKNSKVISMLNTEEGKENYNKLEIESISDLLVELDSVRRELSDQIEINKAIKNDKLKLKQEYQDLENEMNQTILSYQEVLESQQNESTGDSFRIKKQLLEQQDLVEKLQMENKAHENAITKLNKKIHKYKNQNGIPSSQVKKIEEKMQKYQTDITDLESKVSKYESSSFMDKKSIQQLETEKLQLTNYLTKKEKDEGKFMKALKEKDSIIKKLEKEITILTDRVKEAAEVNTVQEQNEALITQKNALLKFKETIGKELEKLKNENQKKDLLLQEKDREIDNIKAEADLGIERLRKANQRLSEENLEMDNQYIMLQKEHKSLRKHMTRLSNSAISGDRSRE